jgi:peptidylprolyl isomerase
MRPTVRAALTFAVAALVALGPSACGKSSDNSNSSSSSNKSSSASAAKTGTKPAVTVPSGPAPTTLQKQDLIPGTGAEAVPGKKVSVQYVGVSYSTGKQFDASWDRGEPFSFTLGAGDVIKGWDQGVPGMKVGGRRQLIIPPGLAYGPAGAPPAIGPNETLIFVIDLLSVT